MVTLPDEGPKTRLFKALLGDEYQANEYSSTYYAFLRAQVKAFDKDDDYFSRSFASILDVARPFNLDVVVDDIISLSTLFVSQLSTRATSKATMDGLLNHFLHERGESGAPLDAEATKHAQQAPFAIVGWLSLLYEPACTVQPGLFSTVSTRARDTDTDIMTKNISCAKRPLSTMLMELGQELPPLSSDTTPKILYASSISFYSLKSIGNIKDVVWSKSLAAHLQFDISTRTLTLFQLPSFCAMYCIYGDHSHLLSLMLSGYLTPRTGGIKAMMQEVLLSYRILFGQSRQSRQLYNATEKRRAHENGNGCPDPLLDLLCGQRLGNKKIQALPSCFWPLGCRSSTEKDATLLEQSVYNTATDFPIFGMRLDVLMEFSNRQRPSLVRDLWSDRRDPLQWYTFWAVFWIGGASILLSFTQVAIAAAQLHLAAHPPTRST